MKKAILARKVGMTQIFINKGILVPVTVLEAGPCVVVQRKTVEKDGYDAIQVGFEDVRTKKGAPDVNRPKKGHFNKANVACKKVLREFRIEDADKYPVGSEIKADAFKDGDKVDVTAVSKGKGYQGAIKRHGQHRGPMSHGSKYHRGLGSLGSSASPSKVKKGKKMPGHMGNVKVTVQNLEVVRADADKNLILVKGAVPGPRGSLVVVKDSVKN